MQVMRRWQIKKFPRLAIYGKTLSDIDMCLSENKTALNFTLDIKNEKKNHKIEHKLIVCGDKSHLILFDRDFIFEIDDGKFIFLDATFSIVPRVRGIKQFLTIMVKKHGHVRCYH